MRISKFAAELMDYLRPAQWKTTLQLYEEIEEKWKRDDRRSLLSSLLSLFSKEWGEAFSGPNFSQLFIALEELESQDLIEGRWKAMTAEELAKRGGRRGREWKLTNDGVRVRNLLPQLEQEGADILIPSPAQQAAH